MDEVVGLLADLISKRVREARHNAAAQAAARQAVTQSTGAARAGGMQPNTARPTATQPAGPAMGLAQDASLGRRLRRDMPPETPMSASAADSGTPPGSFDATTALAGANLAPADLSGGLLDIGSRAGSARDVTLRDATAGPPGGPGAAALLGAFRGGSPLLAAIVLTEALGPPLALQPFDARLR